MRIINRCLHIIIKMNENIIIVDDFILNLDSIKCIRTNHREGYRIHYKGKSNVTSDISKDSYEQIVSKIVEMRNQIIYAPESPMVAKLSHTFRKHADISDS